MRSLLFISALLVLTGAGCSVGPNPEKPYTPPLLPGQTDPNAPIEAPQITTKDQPITDGRVILGPVTMPVDGWMVGYADNAGKPGRILGYGHLYADEYPVVNLPINELDYTGKVFVVIHHDKGANGKFDFPGPDMPIEIDGLTPTESFVIE